MLIFFLGLIPDNATFYFRNFHFFVNSKRQFEIPNEYLNIEKWIEKWLIRALTLTIKSRGIISYMGMLKPILYTPKIAPSYRHLHEVFNYILLTSNFIQQKKLSNIPLQPNHLKRRKNWKSLFLKLQTSARQINNKCRSNDSA